MKRFSVLLIVGLITLTAKAQYNLDVGLKLGASNYLGEMGGKEGVGRNFIYDLKLSQTRFAAGTFVRYRITPLVSVNTGFSYFRLQGDDKLSTNPGRAGRNLNFRNDMFEWYLRSEFYYFTENDVGGRGRRRMDFRAAAFLGTAIATSNPKANYQGEWIPLRPLRTEGQVREYSRVIFALPAGLGFYFTYKRRQRMGLEFSWYTTFTDYLDDVSSVYPDESLLTSDLAIALSNRNPELGSISEGTYDLDLYPHPANYGSRTDLQGSLIQEQRGNPDNNDSYLLVNLTYSYVLRGKSNFYRQRYGWLVGKKRRGRKSRAKF